MAVSVTRDVSDQPMRQLSLIIVFAVRVRKVCVLSNPLLAQRRLYPGRAELCADPESFIRGGSNFDVFFFFFFFFFLL